MGTITAIKPQRRPGRYNVMVDGAFTIAVSEKVLIDLSLSVGKELDDARIVEASKAEDKHKALAAALRLLESRPRSEHEILTRLKSHGYGQETNREVIDKLRGYGFVDDVQFTSSWIESRSRSSPEGKYKLQSELSQKGIAGDTIKDAIGQITEDMELDLARKAIAKRTLVRSTNHEERQAAFAKDAGYLARRGFGWNVVKPVLKERYGSEVEEADD